MDKKVVMGLIGGAAALVGIAVAIHFLNEKSEASGGDDGEDVADLDAEIESIGAIERDQQGMIKWA